MFVSINLTLRSVAQQRVSKGPSAKCEEPHPSRRRAFFAMSRKRGIGARLLRMKNKRKCPTKNPAGCCGVFELSARKRLLLLFGLGFRLRVGLGFGFGVAFGFRFLFLFRLLGLGRLRLAGRRLRRALGDLDAFMQASLAQKLKGGADAPPVEDLE